MTMIGAVVIWNSSKAFLCADQIDGDNDARDLFSGYMKKIIDLVRYFIKDHLEALDKMTVINRTVNIHHFDPFFQHLNSYNSLWMKNKLFFFFWVKNKL